MPFYNAQVRSFGRFLIEIFYFHKIFILRMLTETILMRLYLYEVSTELS